MTDYLNKTFNWQSQEIASTYDDMPIWSAMPGNLLLETIHYATNKTIIDIGFGTGFPLLPLAERFGATCRLYGVDLWETAMNHAKLKAKHRGVNNITFLNSSADKIDIESTTVDVITSNLGINNFANPGAVISECYRLLKPKGKLYLSTNLTGTFDEFYAVFNEVLKQTNNTEALELLQQHIATRATIQSTQNLFIKEGFKADEAVEKSCTMSYANGSAFLNDYFIVMAFLPSWKEIVAPQKQQETFNLLESKLNKIAAQENGLKLTVPYVVLQFIKQ